MKGGEGYEKWWLNGYVRSKKGFETMQACCHFIVST
jgi:hypothetical protein